MKTMLHWIRFSIILILVGCEVLDDENNNQEDKQSCFWDGKEYKHSSTYDLPPCDSCGNYCTCIDGEWACTDCSCDPVETCKYGNDTYFVGDTFSTPDGCNTCECTSTGVTCGSFYCPPKCEYSGQYYDEGEQIVFPCNGCENTCTCELIDWKTRPLWSCTECGCQDTCIVDEIEYEIGETFSPDPETTCECRLVHTILDREVAEAICRPR